jgi:hypothetical protein
MAARRGKPIGYRTSNECNSLLVGVIRPQTVTGPLGSPWLRDGEGTLRQRGLATFIIDR